MDGDTNKRENKMDTKENYLAMVERIRNESSIEGLRKLEESNERLYNNDCLKGFEFRHIDLLIMEKIAVLG